MSPAIRAMVVPVTDRDAAKAVHTALLGGPHTHQPFYVGYTASADVDDLGGTRQRLLAAGASERHAPRQVAPGWCLRVERQRRQPHRPPRTLITTTAIRCGERLRLESRRAESIATGSIPIAHRVAAVPTFL
jgi:hypothetical protein